MSPSRACADPFRDYKLDFRQLTTAIVPTFRQFSSHASWNLVRPSGGPPRGTLGSTPHLNKTREGIFTFNHTPRIGEGLFPMEVNSPKCQLLTSVYLSDPETAK